MIAAVFTLLPAFVPVLLQAHQTNSSYTTLSVSHREVEVMFSFDLTDLERSFTLDANRDGGIDQEEILAAMPRMYAYLQAHFVLSLGYTPVTMTAQEGGFAQDDFGNIYINFIFARELADTPGEIGLHLDFLERFGADHKNFAKVVHGEQVQQGIFTVDVPRARFVIGGELRIWAQVREFLILGVEHIFLGYDHILFLLGLIALGGRFVDLVKIVTSFTVAHSLTLILAALQIVALPTRLVESGIALSIAYVAAENFFLLASVPPAQSDSAVRHRWILTFCFGLVHGFGFANVLRDLGLPARGLVGSLLAFNVGVEVGQVIIAGLCFPLVWWVSRSRLQRPLVFAVSGIILVFGMSWFVERSLALEFMPF